MTWIQRDTAHIWHPYTQHGMNSDLEAIIRGEGAYLIAENGKRYLDLISSWWVNLHGHAHPEIATAIYEQASTLEQVIFAGFTHPSAVKLAEELLALLPDHFAKVFYSDNGSTAVEIALKMAYQYWRNKGKPGKNRFIAFEKGYHGDTLAAMSVGKKSGFFTQFEDLMFSVDTFPFPETWIGDTTVDEKENEILRGLEFHLEKFASETAALIIEPFVQGAGGIRMCRGEFLTKLEKLVHSFDVLIIYDEVMTGFGRTGDFFACRKAGTQPDIICLAKGLTGGFLPLAITVCSDTIFQAFLGDDFSQALSHGHSFTANPLGCAAGLASLAILKRKETQEQIQKIENCHRRLLANLSLCKKRFCGTISAFEFPLDTTYGSLLSLQLRRQFMEQGLLIRPIGNVIYFLPPYCITEQELMDSYEVVVNQLQGILV